MRILFVADGRSPIALNWIEFFIGEAHEVHLATTFACSSGFDFASQRVVPVAFSSLKRAPSTPSGGKPLRRGIWSAAFVSARTRFRQWLGPLTLPAAARRLSAVIQDVQPDLVHAMRIPYEGMLAALALSHLPGHPPPLLVSVWGNDFTLHALANPWMAALTRRVLHTASALHTDCQRDWRLAADWGFESSKPAVVLPGAGGIHTTVFYPPGGESARLDPVAINPRGFRAYIRSDTFFKSIPIVLRRIPQARFLCPTMEGVAQAEDWVDQLGIREAVELLPHLTRSQMADSYRRARIVVSPSTHDGTPNTLLEAMACGCLPVAGDLDSLREWITPGENGLLVDPGDPLALADAIIRGLSDDQLQRSALQRNITLIQKRAEYQSVMHTAEAFYQAVAGQ